MEDRADPNEYIERNILKELCAEYSELMTGQEALEESLAKICYETGSQFVIIFDEWDYPIRELGKDRPEREGKVIWNSCLTGILPMVRAKGQSAVNNFKEFTMVKGFTDLVYLPLSRNANLPVILVEFDYDKETKEHECVMEQYKKQGQSNLRSNN